MDDRDRAVPTLRDLNAQKRVRIVVETIQNPSNHRHDRMRIAAADERGRQFRIQICLCERERIEQLFKHRPLQKLHLGIHRSQGCGLRRDLDRHLTRVRLEPHHRADTVTSERDTGSDRRVTTEGDLCSRGEVADPGRVGGQRADERRLTESEIGGKTKHRRIRECVSTKDDSRRVPGRRIPPHRERAEEQDRGLGSAMHSAVLAETDEIATEPIQAEWTCSDQATRRKKEQSAAHAPG